MTFFRECFHPSLAFPTQIQTPMNVILVHVIRTVLTLLDHSTAHAEMAFIWKKMKEHVKVGLRH